jgi:predicted acylesterase/phospholipase RssA
VHPISQSVEEIRVALALNGGVSLAVWMGGCAVELDSARRAHIGPEELAYDDGLPAPKVPKTRFVYNAICDAFGRRLVLDILSGASAGGVNGALLGAAMKAARRLHPEFVRREWIQLGDFSLLLHKSTEEKPRALMQGELFHKSLDSAFQAVLDEGGDGPAPEPRDLAAGALPPSQVGLEPSFAKLDVTMTAVDGIEMTFHDQWGGDLVAREHRLRFRFRKEVDYTVAGLAAAARTSASFPVAFEPWPVKGAAAGLAGLAEDETTYGIDGGLLDNAPIRAALDLIPGQTASNPVRRLVCYLNADPPQSSPGGEDDGEPTLKDVLGYVINLPRVAPFVDQLYAVRDATRRAELAPLVQDPLLTLPLQTLTETAVALLPAYQKRRTTESLDELLEAPSASEEVARRLEEAGARLPWVPANLAPPAEPGDWHWGARPAERILHLLLDLLRRGLADAAGEETRGPLLDLREAIGVQLEELETIRGTLTSEPGVRAEVEQLAAGEGNPAAIAAGLEDLTAEPREEAHACVLAAAEAFKARLDAEGPPGFLGGLYTPLFGPPGSEEGWFATFLARMLAIEVVRRAFAAEADIDTAQTLRFVQLTPAAPTPILTANPFEPGEPADPREKLNGVGLNHFAGFYRRSWRANDFMWGRLDAAARIVEMLLDGAAAQTPAEAAATLAAAVLPDGAGLTAAWLAHEALTAQPGGDYAPGGGTIPTTDELRPVLTEAIATELGSGGDLTLTRAVCIRAVQLEILRDELPVVTRESADDRKQGSSSPALDLPAGPEMKGAIEALRTGKPLARRLDDSHEEVSDLGLRTIARSALVGLSAAKAAGTPLTKFLGVARAPLQAIAGVVSGSLRDRATVAMGFWAAALYLTMRFVTAKDEQETLLSEIWSRPVLLSLIAALAVLAVVLVPGLRGWRKVNRTSNWAWAAGLLAAGGAAAALLAISFGHRDVTTVVFGTGAEQLPAKLQTLVLVVVVGIGALRLPMFGSTVNSWLAGQRGGWKLCGPLLLTAALVAGFSIPRLTPVFGDSCWQTIGVVVALLVALALAAVYLLPRRSPQ